MTSSRRALSFLIGVAVVLVLLAIGVRVTFGWYLESDGFRQRIATATGNMLKADAQLMPLHRTGATLYSDGLAARGTGAAFFSDLRADEIRALVDWRGIFHRRWQIDELNVQRLDVTFARFKPTENKHSPQTQAPIHAGWKVDARRVFFRDSRWHWDGGNIVGASLTLTPDDEGWTIESAGGKAAQNGWPELQIESAKLRYNKSTLWIAESALRAGGGRLAVTGEVNFDRAAELQATLDHITIDPLLPPDWRARLSGKVSGRVKIAAPLTTASDLRASGSLSLGEAQITALPVLAQIATFTRTERFRRISLTNASLDFTRDAKTIMARNVILESEGLLRIEGSFQIVNDAIDGQFQIGVTAASLQWLPGSRARVFTTAHGGYQWTTLHVRGPVSHPAEDLTARLLAAAGEQLLDDAGTNVLQTFRGLLDLVPR